MRKWEKIRVALLIIAGLLPFVSFWQPMWSFYLWSNSYPYGIGMAIYSCEPADPIDVAEMDGGLDELQVLNHYIGMKPISPDLIIFKLLPLLLILVGVLLIISAFWRKRWVLPGAFGVNALVGIYGMISFAYYIYTYGHDLDPAAAISVPPFMPSIIGEGHLAQFTTWAEFGWGTYAVVTSTFLAALVLFIDWWLVRKQSGTIAKSPHKKGEI